VDGGPGGHRDRFDRGPSAAGHVARVEGMGRRGGVGRDCVDNGREGHASGGSVRTEVRTRLIPDLWPRFPPSARSGWPDGLSLPRSGRRNAPRGPNSSRSRNLRFAPIPRGLAQSFSIRGRRGGFAAPGAVVPGLCCGQRYAAIWRSQATAISRRFTALATTPSAAAPRRLETPRTPGIFPARGTGK